MNIQEVKERINDNVMEVVSNYVELKKHGMTYQGLCPFHQEKTPSFTVNAARGIYKCFGCGKGGDAISFIMENDKVDFIGALKQGAKLLQLSGIEWNEDKKDWDSEDYKHKEALRILCDKVAEHYQGCLKASKEATDYIAKRKYTLDENDLLMIGYAPSGNALMKWGKENGISLELMKEAGLVSHNAERDRDQDYDYFRDRIMFPVCAPNGKAIGFSGRLMVDNPKSQKYINSPDTLIYNKKNVLYALNIARHHIKGENRAYLVEGNFDVKRLHTIHVMNVVATCGTALTDEQIALLKKYTQNVTMIYDGDKAGRNAIVKNGDALIRAQFNVHVIHIPQGEDPDSLFVSPEKFEEFKDKEENNTEYLVYRTLQGKEMLHNPSFNKSEFINEIVGLICCYESECAREVHLDGVIYHAIPAQIGPKKAWQSSFKSMVADKTKVKKIIKVIPEGITAQDLMDSGFYVEHNCYHFYDSKGTPHQRSNFTLAPLFHVESTLNAKRLYEVKNESGLVRVVEIPQKDMVSLTAFQVHLESLGNFWFDGSQADLNRLKRWLYSKTESCKELVQLGWQKEGFWAWGNGIFNSEFTPVDSYGIAKHGAKSYYIPAFSTIYDHEEGLYQFERKFIHMESNITLKEYCAKFIKVFGDNAKIAMCFYFASLFRDIVVRRFGIYPVLNMFGPKGAGKTACAESIMQFFGRLGKAPNVHNTSLPALGEHVATSCNAICHIDEYRNDIDMMKREFLKGLWDGSGRSKMNMDKDKKKEMTLVDQAIILTGQQMATADIALLSRLIFLSFTQVEFSEKEREDFVSLKEIEKLGLTHITHQILRLRGHFKEKYLDHVRKVDSRMREMMGRETVEDRIFNNWLIPIAAYSTLNEYLELPWDEDELTRMAVVLMIGQNRVTKQNDDLGNFWKVIQFLISSNMLYEEGDYKILYEDKYTRRYFENKEWGTEEVHLKAPADLLYITTSRIFSLYKSQCLKEGDKPLPESTIEYYLKNCHAFIAETKKESFKKIDPKTGMQEVSESDDGQGHKTLIKKRTSTTALIFYLDKTGLAISRTVEKEKEAVAGAEAGTEAVKEEAVQGSLYTGDKGDDNPF
jgi:DNA primase